MACGCGKKAASGEQWQATPSSGDGVQTFDSKTDADAYLIKRGGGVVRKL